MIRLCLYQCELPVGVQMFHSIDISIMASTKTQLMLQCMLPKELNVEVGGLKETIHRALSPRRLNRRPSVGTQRNILELVLFWSYQLPKGIPQILPVFCILYFVFWKQEIPHWSLFTNHQTGKIKAFATRSSENNSVSSKIILLAFISFKPMWLISHLMKIPW